jgi:hypothetical protein
MVDLTASINMTRRVSASRYLHTASLLKSFLAEGLLGYRTLHSGNTDEGTRSREMLEPSWRPGRPRGAILIKNRQIPSEDTAPAIEKQAIVVALLI